MRARLRTASRSMAVAVQCEGRDDEVVEVDARFGQHGQKALRLAGGGDALQKRGQPELEMTPDALGDLGVLQPLRMTILISGWSRFSRCISSMPSIPGIRISDVFVSPLV